jgi:hypothetical protein
VARLPTYATNRSLREVLYALPNHMPISNFSLSSDFGIRKHPLTGKSHFHTGVDLMSETGDDKVFSVKPGVVVMSEFHPQYGNTVVVRHSNGVESLYAHMAQLLVKVGDKVTTDHVLGYIGNTGFSTGKHLQFADIGRKVSCESPKSDPHRPICSANPKQTTLMWLLGEPQTWPCLRLLYESAIPSESVTPDQPQRNTMMDIVSSNASKPSILSEGFSFRGEISSQGRYPCGRLPQWSSPSGRAHHWFTGSG